MTDFKEFNSVTHPIVKLNDDWNQLLDHGLVKTASYIIRARGGVYEATDGDTGKVLSSGLDAGVVINAAILATASGTIKIRNGVYTCATGIVGKNGVSLSGESMGPFEDFTKGAIINYIGAGKAVNYDECRWFGLDNLKIYGGNGTGTHGLFFGGAHNDATKTKAITLQNVVIDGFDYGIQGNTFGPDDSNYYHIFVTNNSIIGIDNLSSMSRFYGGSIAGNPIGFRIRRAVGGGSADAGAQFFGTVFSNNPVHLDISGGQSINILSLHSCWLEDTDTLILDTSNATPGISIGSILFDNCVATVNDATATSYFNLSGVNATLRFLGGTLYSGTSKTIVTDGVGGTFQRLSICPEAGVDKYTFNDSNDGSVGFNLAVIDFINDNVGYQPGAPLGGAYAAVWQSLKITVNQLYIVKAKVYYRWTPGSVGGKIRLHTTLGNFGAAEPASAPTREDTIECTNNARSYLAATGDVDIQMADDNITAPIIKYCVLYYWY